MHKQLGSHLIEVDAYFDVNLLESRALRGDGVSGLGRDMCSGIWRLICQTETTGLMDEHVSPFTLGHNLNISKLIDGGESLGIIPATDPWLSYTTQMHRNESISFIHEHLRRDRPI